MTEFKSEFPTSIKTMQIAVCGQSEENPCPNYQMGHGPCLFFNINLNECRCLEGETQAWKRYYEGDKEQS